MGCRVPLGINPANFKQDAGAEHDRGGQAEDKYCVAENLQLAHKPYEDQRGKQFLPLQI